MSLSHILFSPSGELLFALKRAKLLVLALISSTTLANNYSIEKHKCFRIEGIIVRIV